MPLLETIKNVLVLFRVVLNVFIKLEILLAVSVSDIIWRPWNVAKRYCHHLCRVVFG